MIDKRILREHVANYIKGNENEIVDDFILFNGKDYYQDNLTDYEIDELYNKEEIEVFNSLYEIIKEISNKYVI